ncbi:sensor histidine kinase [Paracoccus sp. 228]|uniref:sensor histidine kinase n=1 Tax=Paracoccus sp. 228 TaxID=1192054 RepID=UPI0018DEB25A|nr:hypothetical protein [Paracoccus sp. 228]
MDYIRRHIPKLVVGGLTGMSDAPLLSPETRSRPVWQGLGLLRRHLSSCALIIVVGLAILGVWTASRLQQTVETEVGHRAATVLGSMLNRHAEDLAADTLSPELIGVIDTYFHDISDALGISEMKIWNAQGTILYASRPGLTGSAQPVSDELATALAGEISVSVGDTFHVESGWPSTTTGPQQFEIYVPIRIRSLNRIVAVAEYYQNAAVVSDALTRARWQTWGLLTVIGAMFVAILVMILRYGDAVILRQRTDLSARMADLVLLLDRTRETQARIHQRTIRLQEEQKAQLRQINSDIHDGIGQLLTVALLRMKSAPPSSGPQEDGVQSVRLILEEAMSEVQALLSGTSQRPVAELPLADAVSALVEDHRRRTSTEVRTVLADRLPEPSLPVKVAICRVVQEGLHNAFKHAGGRDQQVHLYVDHGTLVIAVSNDARHGQDACRDVTRQPMGLRNLRHRIENLGGIFQVLDLEHHRMEIRASFHEYSMEHSHE